MGSKFDPNVHVGERHGMLTILAFDHYNASRNSFYLCHCDCCVEKVVSYSLMMSGRAVSCGCYRRTRNLMDPNIHIGETYNRLTIIAFSHRGGKRNEVYYKCKCICGNERTARYTDLRSGAAKSCGCYLHDKLTKHGMTNTRIYYTYRNMLNRCYNSHIKEFVWYGARGIRICDEWLDPDIGFINFYNWAMSHGYTDELTIDRIDNDGNYEPSNCRWVTRKEQLHNRRNNVYVAYLLNKKSNPPYLVYDYSEWAKITGVSSNMLRGRVINRREKTINGIIEECYRIGHHIPDDQPLEMEINNSMIKHNHIDKFSRSIHD